MKKLTILSLLFVLSIVSCQKTNVAPSKSVKQNITAVVNDCTGCATYDGAPPKPVNPPKKP